MVQSVSMTGIGGVEPPQGGQVTQHRGGEFLVGGEVEVLEGGLFLELGAPSAWKFVIN